MFGAAQGWNREVPDDVRNESCCPSSGSSGIPPPRATPLVWLTVNKAELKDRRSLYEHRVLVRLAEILPANVTVCIIADRGFGDQNLYRVLTEDRRAALRLRHTLPRQHKVTAATGGTRTAAAWVSPSGRARVLRGTADCYPAGTVVCVLDPDMKQAWCLAASSADATACDLTGYYGSRWALRLGCAIPRTCASAWGWAGCTSARPNGGTGGGNALAVVLSTLLAAASEAVGYDRTLKTNTSKRREHSLFRQGCMVYDLIPTMPERWLHQLM
jgi:hypothetical protein